MIRPVEAATVSRMEHMHEYRTLGRSGLKVSPLALGVMTYGWGADLAAARTLFDLYRDAGGNFVDTADMYSGGESEEWLGRFVKDTGSRDELVIATKFSFNAQQGNPNAGGNGRKNIRRAIEGSLRRLQTDYVDLYIVHAWDRVTPVEEVMSTLDDLVRAGKVLHIGMSDVPAWYASRAQALAEAHRLEPLSTLQLEYSLVSRSLEREHVPLARATGMSITPWSPLASGFLTGKYSRGPDGVLSGDGRVQASQGSGNPTLEKFARSDRNWRILAELEAVATELDRAPAEVALAWVQSRPQVTSTLIGATRREQLELNLRSLAQPLPPEAAARLTEVSRPESNELDHFFEPTMQAMITGGVQVTPGIS